MPDDEWFLTTQVQLLNEFADAELPIYVDYDVAVCSSLQACIILGVPCSGKTTYCASLRDRWQCSYRNTAGAAAAAVANQNRVPTIFSL